MNIFFTCNPLLVKIFILLLTVSYQDNQFDLFGTTSGQKITLNLTQNQPDKKILLGYLENSTFFVIYSDNTCDLFNIQNGQKIKIKQANTIHFVQKIVVPDAQKIEIKQAFVQKIVAPQDNKNTLFIVRQDNHVDLFDIASKQKINSVQANIIKNQEIPNQEILVLITPYGDIDLFDIRDGHKINEHQIQAQNKQEYLSSNIWDNQILVQTNKRITETFLCGSIFCVRYSDNQFNLFNTQTGLFFRFEQNKNKINSNPIQAQKYKNIKNVHIIGSNFTDFNLCITYSDNTIDIFDKISGKKIIPSPKKETSKLTGKKRKREAKQTIEDNKQDGDNHKNKKKKL